MRHHYSKSLSLDHQLYMPNALVSGMLPASVDPNRVVDASRVSQLCAIIQALFDDAPMPSGDNLADPSDIHNFLLDRVQAAPHIGLLGKSTREITSRVSVGLDIWVSRLTITPHRLQGNSRIRRDTARAARAKTGGPCWTASSICLLQPTAGRCDQGRCPHILVCMTIHEFARALGEQDGQEFDFAADFICDVILIVGVVRHI